METEKKMVVDTTLAHTVVNNIPIIDLRDIVVQEVLDLDFATSETFNNLFINIYRTRGRHPTFFTSKQAFLSIEEAHENAYRPEWNIAYEGVLPVTVRQAKQYGHCWGQNPALVRKIKEEWDSIPLSQDEEEEDD